MEINKKIKGVVALFVLLLGLIIFVYTVAAIEEPEVRTLYEGKNNITFNQTSLLAKDIVFASANIQAISYIDENEKTVGFIRALGGIGKNFIIEPNKEYEIIATNETILMLP